MKRQLAVLLMVLACDAALGARPSHAPHPGLADAEVQGSVRNMLHARLGEAAGRIDVAVQDGYVFLYGKVRSERLRARAERLASRVGGVREVSNELVAANRTESGIRPNQAAGG